MPKDAREVLSGLMSFLSTVAVSTVTFGHDEMDPAGFITEVINEFDSKALKWQDELVYVPNLVHILVPPMKPKKLQELETIFNTLNFIEHLYSYVSKFNYRLFDFIRVEVDVLPGFPQKRSQDKRTNRCHFRLEWPNHVRSTSGLDVVVEANQERIVKVYRPKPEIDLFALLQPINARAFRDHYLIIKKKTHLGRNRNVFSARGELVVRNDFPFARTGDPINKSLSRQHARIEFDNGGFNLIDCGSRRGTFIQRFKKGWQEILVDTGQGVRLEDRDIIRMGSALLAFELVKSEHVPTLIRQLYSEGRLDTGMIQQQAQSDMRFQTLRSFAALVKRFDVDK